MGKGAPESRAREQIDKLLTAASWAVQDVKDADIHATRGVALRTWAMPRRLLFSDGHVRGVEFETTRTGEDGKVEGTGQIWTLDADVVFKAIGQKMLTNPLTQSAEIVELKDGRILCDEERRSSLPGVWAGGDCVFGGEDLTVSAVQDGKVAALSIDRFLRK